MHFSLSILLLGDRREPETQNGTRISGAAVHKVYSDIVQLYMYYVHYRKGKEQLLYIYCKADAVCLQ